LIGALGLARDLLRVARRRNGSIVVAGLIVRHRFRADIGGIGSILRVLRVAYLEVVVHRGDTGNMAGYGLGELL